MFLIEKIVQEPEIEYAGFISDTSLNIISNVVSEETFILNLGTSGILVLNIEGITIDIELLSIVPILHHYPIIECERVSNGIPCIKKSKPYDFSAPLVFINHASKTGLLLFNAQEKEADLIVVQKNVRFILKNMKLIAVEVLDLIYDVDGHMQNVWLEKHSIDS